MNNLLHPSKPRFYHRQSDGLNWKPLKVKTWLTIALIVIPTIAFVAVAMFNEAFAEALQQPDFAITKEAGASAEPIAETNEQAEIIAYIKEVFGKDAPKAFKVLSCENASLNPKAVNTAGNHPAGSRDTGVFQINEYWQKVQYKFLLNWKVNVQIAHQIYTENGNTFERWTCGRKFGI